MVRNWQDNCEFAFIVANPSLNLDFHSAEQKKNIANIFQIYKSIYEGEMERERQRQIERGNSKLLSVQFKLSTHC